MIQQTGTPATAELRARTADLRDLADQVTGDAGALGYRIARAAEDVAQYATITAPVEYATSAVDQACAVLSWQNRLTGTVALDRPSHGGRTPRQHVAHALTTIASHLEVGVVALADIYADAASATALGAAGRYSQGWAPSTPVPSIPPATVRPAVHDPGPDLMSSGAVLAIAAAIVLVCWLLLGACSSATSSDTRGLPAHPTISTTETR